MARVIAVCNQKGGVGKTTTSVNVAAYLAAHGKRTLLVDFDPQGNASSALKGSDTVRSTIYEGIVTDMDHRELIHPSSLMNLHYIAAGPDLAGLLVELIEMPDRERVLRRILDRFRDEYAYIVIDLPPSMSLLAVNGLVAADEVLIPVQTNYYSLEGLGQLLTSIELIKDNLAQRLQIAGAVLTMYDPEERLSIEVARNLRKHFPHQVFATEIPRSSALAEAPSFGKPVLLHKPTSSGAYAYRDLVREIIKQSDLSSRGSRAW